MFFKKKEQKKSEVVVEESPEFPQPENDTIDYHAITFEALKNLLKMSKQDKFSISPEKVTQALIEELTSSEIQIITKILARSQVK